MTASFFRKAYWTFATLGGLWAICIGLLLVPDLQRFAIYAHKINTAYWSDLNAPEQWGFLPGQVHPFNLTTQDDEILFAWHILPLGVYRKHQVQLLATRSQSSALEILKADPNARLVIKFHGNAGHVAQGWRPDAYRMLIGAEPESIHVLAFDYRGFGLSTGSPTEAGVIQDGIAAVEWALNIAELPPSKIVLYGQSLGTAVATAVAEHFALDKSIEFAGLILVAPFASMPDLLPRYFIAGFLPTLSPLQAFPRILKLVLTKVADTWTTNARLARLVRGSKSINLSIIHARNDAQIPSKQSEHLFLVAANATTAEGMDFNSIMNSKQRSKIAGGGWVDSWAAPGTDEKRKKVKFTMFPSGGHNQIMTWPVAAAEVLDCFDRVNV